MYMLQEIDILEDWTAIKKVGPVLPATGWGLSVRRPLPSQTGFGLYVGLPLGSSLVSPRHPLLHPGFAWPPKPPVYISPFLVPGRF